MNPVPFRINLRHCLVCDALWRLAGVVSVAISLACRRGRRNLLPPMGTDLT